MFIAVNHGDRGGVSLYLSDPTGRYYVLSLSRVHHRAASYWFDVDMHRVSCRLLLCVAISQGGNRNGKSVIY